ncbi:MAG: ATP-binding cassette domain-containing protein [Bacteroidales bacterium]|nr:ATP-binding cassette domain-containing protein [Bacteroidales bacterium]
MVGERGINFSGGQSQRIAIARAILKKSKIILFDEATSALDNESQYAIKNAIDTLAKDHTVVIIAHRLFTVIDADEILVIDNGKLAGTGTHEMLMNNNSIYKSLYKTEVDTINKRQEEVVS